MPERAKDKVVVVTGATAGIGRAAAAMFKARGARVRAPASRARGRTLRLCEEIPPFRPR